MVIGMLSHMRNVLKCAEQSEKNMSRRIFGWNRNAEKQNGRTAVWFFFANLRTAKLFTIHWLDIIQFCCIITSFRFACKQLRLANSVLSFFLTHSFCLDARRTTCRLVSIAFSSYSLHFLLLNFCSQFDFVAANWIDCNRSCSRNKNKKAEFLLNCVRSDSVSEAIVDRRW